MRPVFPLLAVPWVVAVAIAGCVTAPKSAPAPTVLETVSGTGAARLIVEARGIESGLGQVAFALFDNERDFVAGENPIRRALLPAEGAASIWTVDDLAPGRYAVKAYHDVNGNGRLDFNAFGAPSEPYGFSNGARGRFGPPAFDEAGLVIEAGETPTVVTLR